jgi:predicted nucleic acid-binding protein
VDTSVVIAWQNREEPAHAAAVAMLADWPDLVMHAVNFAEMLAGVEKSQWADLARVMRAHGFAFHDTAAEALADAKRDTGLKMPDACVIAVAKAEGADAVLTLDDRLARAARAQGLAAPR